MKFYKEVETYFLETRGKLFGLSSYNLLSPKEIQAIKKWETLGIPLKVIEEAIETSLKKFLLNYPSRRDDPPSLLYCQRVLLTMWKEYKNASVGGKAESRELKNDRENLEFILKFNISSLEGSKPALTRIIDENRFQEMLYSLDSAKKSLEKRYDLISNGEENATTLSEAIEEIKTGLLQNLKQNVSFEALKNILQEIKKEIGDYKMSKSVYRDTRNIIFDDKLLDSAGLSKIRIP
jgi:hypothetical protein